MKFTATFLLAASICTGIGVSAQAESLSAAVRRALTTNPAIKATTAEAMASAFELYQLREEYLPTVELFGEAGYQHINDPAFLPTTDNDITQPRNMIGINAKYVLFDGFRRANLVYARSSRVDGQVFRLLDASETMALNAAEAYIDVHRHRQLLGVAQRNLERHRDIASRVKVLVDGGRLPFSDMLTIEDRIDAASLTIIDVNRSLRDASARYERVIGVPPGSGMSVPVARIPGSLNQLLDTALKQNFRVQHAQTKIDETRFNSEVVLSDNLPELSLNAGGGYGENRNGLTGERTDAYVGLRFRWTLYQGGRKFERNALAELGYQAAHERDTAVREVREMATQSWNNYVASSQRARQLAEQLEVNRLIVELYNDEFDAAKRTLLDLLEVERSRFNVEFQKVSSDSSNAFSTYRVLAAQSSLAGHFGVKASDMALEPKFGARAKTSPTFIFNTTIEPLQ